MKLDTILYKTLNRCEFCESWSRASHTLC